MASPLSFQGEKICIPVREGLLTSIVFTEQFYTKHEIVLIGTTNLRVCVKEGKEFSKTDLNTIALYLQNLHLTARKNGRQEFPLSIGPDYSKCPELLRLVQMIIELYAENEKNWPLGQSTSNNQLGLLNYSDPTRNVFGQKVG